MMVIFIVLYLTLAHVIQMSQTLECYSCSGGQACGILFSPTSININKVRSSENEPFSSCSITVTPEGLTSRDVVPSHKCRSSSYQFCCNEDLCNSLASPPLPALTSLKCAIGRCVMSDGICINDAPHVTLLSSPTESCSITSDKGVHYKYYKKNCQPTVKDVSRQRFASVGASSVFCCNSPECNQEILTNAVKDSTIQCYTCDSRITGLAGCMTFDESSPYVYKTGSSSHSEACATIVGLAGRDAATGTAYPAFAIRTFISKCVNQSAGTVKYGGTTFQGRLECCTSHFCNKQNLGVTKPRGKFSKKRFIIIGPVIVLLILAGIGIGSFIYRSCQKKDKGEYNSCATREPTTAIWRVEREPVQRAAIPAYPDASAAPGSS